jgi:hypothetical protein
MNERQARQEHYDRADHAARQDVMQERVRRGFANHRQQDGASVAEGPMAEGSDTAGSVRHSLTVLLPLAAATELVLGLVSGLPGLGLGAAVLAAVGLLTARYVAGAASQDSGYRREARLMGTRAPALGDWYWTVGNGLDVDAYPSALRPQLQRLYAARLSERHGVSLHAEPAKAAALIGPAAWPWLDPEHAPPSATVTPDQLNTLIHRLDTL